ncbi:hypothetical protein H8790_11995 [Oscillibacter hominis]|uniref:Uncharacterized protein n=1 Tax=Oscillibacter hominis TaxID=2763056 RepID=A0A7G9B3L4_9FIRM|nr:hypothetical protein [Oscillibacter hominis]QNL44145.1 hypothetical protein H8790_11995 [Oscillibacter hominis]
MKEGDSGFLCQALSTLNQSQHYLTFIIAAVFLSYGVLSEQKRQLICRESDPQSLFPWQALSSILTICALVFFFRLSEQSNAQQTGLERKLSEVNRVASSLVLAAALMRFWTLLQSSQLSGSAGITDEEVESSPA